MRVFKALGLAIAMIAAICVVSAAPATAAGGGFSCSGSGGTLTATPGLLLRNSAPQSIKGGQGGLACTGGYVTAGKLKIAVTTPNVRCSGLIYNLTTKAQAKGTAYTTWSAPLNMGGSTFKFNMKFVSTVGHTTTGTISGVVTTTGSSLAAGKPIVGTFVLNKGLKSTGLGGDCSITSPLTTFNFTSLAFHTVG